MLSSQDHRVIGEALRAAADGPFFPDWEFKTLFGLAKEEVRAFAKDYKPASDVPVKLGWAVHNALGNLIGYPHGQSTEWTKWISVSPRELEAVFGRWRAAYEYA